MYRKTVNMTSDITSYVITCQASFNVSDFDVTEYKLLNVANDTPSSVSLWNSSEISLSLSRKYFNTD